MLITALALSAQAAAPPAPQGGLWVGPLHVCQANVRAANTVFAVDGSPAVQIGFSEELGQRFAAETARMVGHKLRIMLDGRVLMEPIVREPILGGQVSISAGSRAEADAIRAAALRGC